MKKELILFFIVFLLSGCVTKDKINENKVIRLLQVSNVEKSARNSLHKAEKIEDLNAFIYLNGDQIIREAQAADMRKKNGQTKGILDGVLIAVKDNIHVAGVPNTAGTPGLKNFVPQHDAPAIKRLKDAGAIIFGKTNMHELAFGISSYNNAFYKNRIGVRNPHDVELMAGGSSGGTAVAIASGVVKVGLGTDTGGSSRIPAALNGIVGFRPTVGRYSQEGITPISHTRDTIGPMASNVEGVMLLDAVMADDYTVFTLKATNNYRLGFAKEFLQNMEPEVEGLWQKALHKLKKSGIVLVEVDASMIFELNGKIGFPIALYEAGLDMRSYLTKYGVGKSIEQLAKDIASPDVARTYKELVIPAKLPTSDGVVDARPVYIDAIKNYRPALIAEYERLFTENKLDALIFPTTPAVAKAANPESSSLENFLLFIQNTDPGSNAGIPGLSIPMGMTQSGLPAGIEIDGPQGSDAELLVLGLALESIIAE